jgi:hypothetical protein
MTFLKRLAVVLIVCIVLLLGISIVTFQPIAPITAYSAEPLEINTAKADELKELPRIWRCLFKEDHRRKAVQA